MLYEGVQQWGAGIWTNESVVSSQTALAQAWASLFGPGTAVPAVDFSKEVVVLNVARGDYYPNFQAFYEGTGLRIEYRSQYMGSGRRDVYRATAVPKVSGTITWVWK
jgi:hypothetical protein